MAKKSKFAKCAMVSGLVLKEELEEGLAKLRLERAAAGNEGASIKDEDLAQKLVDLEVINRWQADQLLAGRTKFSLGPYQVIDSIGQGGMGQVFKAEHAIMGRIVAVKVLPRSKSSPEAVVNFNREVRTQAQLDHENLVRAHDAGHDGQVHFLVTEYVPGTDLRKLVRTEGPLSVGDAAAVIVQAARGLQYAHARGLVHRDIKPGNILVTPEGRTKLSDLGLASYFTEDDPNDTRRNKVVGTADYIAPEQVLKPGLATVSSDIYSLGCTLYYAVTGKVPFPGGKSKDKARAHVTKVPVDPRQINPDINDEFAELIAWMMAKKAEARPAEVGEIIAALSPWVPEHSPAYAAIAAAGGAYQAGHSDVRIPPEPGMTESSFLVEPGGEGVEASSGLADRTHPVGSADEETVPEFTDDAPFPLPLLGLILAGGLMVLLVMIFTIASALF